MLKKITPNWYSRVYKEPYSRLHYKNLLQQFLFAKHYAFLTVRIDVLDNILLPYCIVAITFSFLSKGSPNVTCVLRFSYQTSKYWRGIFRIFSLTSNTSIVIRRIVNPEWHGWFRENLLLRTRGNFKVRTFFEHFFLFIFS